MKYNYLSVAITFFLSLFMLSCGSDDDKAENASGDLKSFKELDATSYDKWVYFSFGEGKVLTLSDVEAAASKDWDVAFHRQDIRVNGQKGFSGQGGVSMTHETSFEAVNSTTAHSPFFGNELRKVVIGVNHPPRAAVLKDDKDPHIYGDQYAVNDKISTYTVDMDKMMEGAAAMYQINKNVMIFKAADGKAYKFQVTASVNSMGQKGGTLSFIYKAL